LPVYPKFEGDRFDEEVEELRAEVDVHDPWVESKDAQLQYDLRPMKSLENGRYDAVIVAVAHHQFKAVGVSASRKLCRPEHALFDIK
jgi:UDP-N-acetyl-D-glucosamine/UDP-N-acetyl-D-galactosamine dehydrogenase